MASNSLFTQGLSVDDLLAKRSQRSQEQQRQMADYAAQGALDPQRARMGSMFGSIIGRSLGNNAQGGGDSEMEKLKAENAEQKRLQGEYGRELTTGTPESNVQLGGELIKLGYVDYGSKLLAKGEVSLAAKKEKLALQKRREAVIAAAEKLNLSSTVEMLNNGGDLDAAAAQVRTQEEIGIAEKKGVGGQVALANVYNKGPDFMKKVGNGAYKAMSPTTYVNLLKGKKADLTSFVDSEGSSMLMSVDETGKVFDTEKNVWVNPSELGLNVPSEGEGERLKTEFAQTQGLRNELAKSLNYSNYKESQLQFSKIKTSAAVDSAAGDMSLIFAYMKMLDPDSVVREGEQATAEKARGVADGVLNIYNKAVSGEKMTVTQRADFVNTARKLFKDIKRLADPVQSRIRDITKRYELNEEDVFGKVTEKTKVLTKFETVDRESTDEMKEALEKLSQEERKTLQQLIDDGEF